MRLLRRSLGGLRQLTHVSRVARRAENKRVLSLPGIVHVLALSQHLAERMVTGRAGWGEYEGTDDRVFGAMVHRRVARLLVVTLARGVQPVEHRRARVVQLPHVLLEVEVPAEALAADLAGERLLVVVRVHVEGQIVDLVEGLVADVALVRLLAAVRQLVVLVVALLVKALAAELADERLEVGVDARVGVQGGAPVEGLAAGHAFVRLLSGVDDLVSTEGARLPETFAADFADERPGARVHRHVSREVVVRVEHLPALRAGEGLLLVRGAEVAARRWALLAARVLRRHARQAQSRRGLLDRRRGWRALRDRRRRGRGAWEGPQQRARVIQRVILGQHGVMLQQILMPQGRHVFLERRLEVRRVRRRGNVGRLLQDRRRRRRRRRHRITLLGQPLVRLHDLRDGEGQISAGRRGGHPLGRQAGRCLGRHCAARREWLHGRPATKILTVR